MLLLYTIRRTPSLMLRATLRRLLEDWRTHKYIPLGVLLTLLTTSIVMMYYVNHPGPEPLADTWSYLYVVNRIQTQGQMVNFWRLPGYPLFIILVYALAGQGNPSAVSIAQAVLFILATLELYVLSVLILRRARVAFLIGLLVGANVPLLSYIKPIMSEALGLWLLVSLALCITIFLSRPRAYMLWLITAFLFLLMFTRPEWVFLPVPLFAYLLLIAAWKGTFRCMFLHALASVLAVYAVLGTYMYVNATQNHFFGITWITNINELGKVLQYHMQDEAPPQYTSTRQVLDSYVAKGILDPYAILAGKPSFARDNAALVGSFSKTVIEHHLGEFLIKSVPVFFSSLTIYYTESSITYGYHFAGFLLRLQGIFSILYGWNILFPLCAIIWLLLLCLPRTRKLESVRKMSAILLLNLYGLAITTVGAYRGYDYMRIHTLFDPLLTLVIWATLLIGGLLVVQRMFNIVKRHNTYGYKNTQNTQNTRSSNNVSQRP